MPRRYHHIPPCGGLHSRFSEAYCPDCQTVKYYRTMERLLEERSEYQDAPRPRPRQVYVPATEPRKPEVKGGMNIEPRRS